MTWIGSWWTSQNNSVWTWHDALLIDGHLCDHPSVTALVDLSLIGFSKCVTRLSSLHEEASENHLVFSDYLCPRKQWFSMSRFKRTRHSTALTKVMPLLLLIRHLSDDAWIRIQIVPSATTLRAQAACRSSKWDKPWRQSKHSPLCSRHPILSESGVKPSLLGRTMERINDSAWSRSETDFQYSILGSGFC